MAQSDQPSTLFHLVPLNDLARESLTHPDNQRFVSPSAERALGLEVGFHVSSVPGRVIARLGRDANLILRQRSISAVHVAFELHPDTLVVLLSVRAKRQSSVTVRPILSVRQDGEEITEEGITEEESEGEAIEGDCVLNYGRRYKITIVGYIFWLVWRRAEPAALRELAIQDYQKALQQQINVRSRNLPTELDTEIHTWHNTRIHTSRRRLFREAPEAPRVVLGEGQFGVVYRAVDFESGHPFAIKVIKLEQYRKADVDAARAYAHREVKNLEKLHHKNIIELLDHNKWDSLRPEIFMPLRAGNLRSLAESTALRWTEERLCMEVLEQMLSALDHLACNSMCHRDVKPENILYWDGGDNYTFQLADFGLANLCAKAKSACGTLPYMAPELLLPEYSQFRQSPKMDVWSLFATLADINSRFNFPPRNTSSYADILHAIRVAASLAPKLADMVRENPLERPSAAQLLVAHFHGRGLSTPQAQVPPIPVVAPIAIAPVPGPSSAAPAHQAAFPLVQYPRESRSRQRKNKGREQQSPLRPLGGGVTKQRPAAQPARFVLSEAGPSRPYAEQCPPEREPTTTRVKQPEPPKEQRRGDPMDICHSGSSMSLIRMPGGFLA